MKHFQAKAHNHIHNDGSSGVTGGRGGSSTHPLLQKN